MKPLKKTAAIGRKAAKPSVVAKKRRASLEKPLAEVRKEKRAKKQQPEKGLSKSKAEPRKKLQAKLLSSEEKKKPGSKDSDKKMEKEKKSEDSPEQQADERGKKQICQEAKSRRNDDKRRTSVNGDSEQHQLDPPSKDKANGTLDEKSNGPEKPSDEAKGRKKLAEGRRKSESKDPASKNAAAKEKKRDKDGWKSVGMRGKKEPKPKVKKVACKKTVLAKKSHSPVTKKLVDKKPKLVKLIESTGCLDDAKKKKSKKPAKKSLLPKSKSVVARYEKQAKPKTTVAKPPIKPSLAPVKKDERTKTNGPDKKKKLDSKDADKKSLMLATALERDELVDLKTIKKELVDKVADSRPKKCGKGAAKKVLRKPAKPSSRVAKKQPDRPETDDNSEVSLENLVKRSKICEGGPKNLVNKQDEGLVKIDPKVEAINGESAVSSSSSDSDENYGSRRTKLRSSKKERTSEDERARRMRLFGFWSGPKRHRVASLNALAKVHCLYENEAGGVYLGGFCKPKPEKVEKQRKCKDESMEDEEEANDECDVVKKEEPKEPRRKKCLTVKRKLRNATIVKGKQHWDPDENLATSSSTNSDEEEKNLESCKKTRTAKRKKKSQEVMDLKDMVVCKRMASLNASAILAASYSDEKNRRESSSEYSSESDLEFVKRKKQIDAELDKRKSRQTSDPDDAIKPTKKVVIVNQDTDVTITGKTFNYGASL